MFITTERLLIVRLLENELREIEATLGNDIAGMPPTHIVIVHSQLKKKTKV